MYVTYLFTCDMYVYMGVHMHVHSTHMLACLCLCGMCACIHGNKHMCICVCARLFVWWEEVCAESMQFFQVQATGACQIPREPGMVPGG